MKEVDLRAKKHCKNDVFGDIQVRVSLLSVAFETMTVGS